MRNEYDHIRLSIYGLRTRYLWINAKNKFLRQAGMRMSWFEAVRARNVANKRWEMKQVLEYLFWKTIFDSLHEISSDHTLRLDLKLNK